MEKVRLAGDLELNCDNENKQDGEDTLEKSDYLHGFWNEEDRRLDQGTMWTVV